MSDTTAKCPTCGEQLEMGVRCYLDVTSYTTNEDGSLTITGIEPDNGGFGDQWIGALAFEDGEASIYCPTGCKQPDWDIDLGGLAHWEATNGPAI